MNTRAKGAEYEARAAELLECRGYEILERNFRGARGEIDLIARQENCLVFIEVKYRKTDRFGDAAAAVDPRKQQRLSKMAAFYCLSRRVPQETPCRFDVIAVTGEKLTHYENAFDFRGQR